MKHTVFTTENRCRSCRSAVLEDILSLGTPPLADRLLTDPQTAGGEPLVPLTLTWCPSCSLLQIRETVAPTLLFHHNYPYYSSTSESYLRHARRYAEDIIIRRNPGSASLVMEIACNDGYLLTNFTARGIPVLGIDPAAGPADAAREKNIPVLVDFFDGRLAEKLVRDEKRADVLIANNVLAHVPDPNELIRAAAMVLKPDGLMVVEVPWVLNLLEMNAFDTIYHQHFCYFSITALGRLFRRHGLFINDAHEFPVHGGSIRLYIEKSSRRSSRVEWLLAQETEKGISGALPYHLFAERTQQLRIDLRDLLLSLKDKGFQIAGYGAAAKAATLLHYCGIGREILEWIVDRNPVKQGKYMGENHLPILPVEKLLQHRPDYVLLLSWNLAEEIFVQQEPFRAEGGRFIVPIPSPTIV